MEQLLTGIKVLDLTRVLAGPLCTMMLGDLGADVIKVERPGHGDETRGWGPPFDARGQSAYYLGVNRNKRSIALDFGVSEDAALLAALLAEADVVVENYLPGALARHSLDPATLLARHAQLLWCTIAGFSAEPMRPGYDFVVQAEQGWMSVTGEPDGEAMKHGVALVDVMAGKDAAIAVCAALAARARTTAPLGAARRRLTIHLDASARAALVNVAQNALVSGEPSRRWGNAHANLVPYQAFAARDRALVIAAGSDQQWIACARALGLDALAAAAALATNAGRLADRDRVVRVIASRVRTADAAHWVAALTAAGVPCGLVRTVQEALAGTGASPITGVPPAVPGSVRLPPPMLDEHGAEIRARGWGAFST